ncbi:MAG: polysaccharide biosynthesis tyrosine autokinase [Rikenellaceae bacterium]
MNENLYDQQFDYVDDGFDIVAQLLRYLNYWYIFVASILLMVVGVWLYLKSVTPMYETQASVIIEEQGSKSNTGAMIDIQNLGFFSATSNFDNELEILKSRTLVKNTVIGEELYINYSKKGVFRNEELYKSNPLRLWVSAEDASKLSDVLNLEIKILSPDIIDVTATFVGENGGKMIYSKSFDKTPALLSTPYMSMCITVCDEVAMAAWSSDDVLLVTIENPISVARSYLGALSVQSSSKSTTIANITFQNSSKRRGVDFINRLIALYNKEANDYKNEVALKSSDFIDTRIEIINRELGATEQELEIFKKEAGITDLQRDAQLFLAENSLYKQRMVENNTQLRLVQFLNEYATSELNMNDVLPLNVGLTDVGLTQLIATYNEMLLERKRLLLTSSESNPTVVALDATIASMRANVVTTISSVLQGLIITQNDIEREAQIYAGRISSAPTQEREFMTISRQQEIQSTLYLMLLQKREENALTLASTANNARIINEPLASSLPVSPNKKISVLIALILGVAIPMGLIYLKDLFSFKITERGDVERITKVPIVAEIPTSKITPQSCSIVVQENMNDIMAESFRSLRTNLLFLFKASENVVLVTSTCSGEGKSFISSNLAVSLALMGKRVVVVGLDIRKPGLNKSFGVEANVEGISNYLSNPSLDLLKLVQPTDISPNLSILFGGTIPPNPTELLSRDSLDCAISTLKESYDYVVIDSAPIGMVTDTQIIARVADVSLYVCRANYSNKSDFHFVNELYQGDKMPNMSVVINDVELRKHRYGYYGYGYGYSDEK